MQPRTVSLVLMTPEGRLLGQTPPLTVALPWWQDVSDVVCAAEARYGARVTVLRLLASERPRPPGGWVAYLAEIEETPSEGLQPESEELAQLARRSSPCRAAWAQPGGQRESLAWARAVWPDGGDFRAWQRRVWNLSSLWQLEPGAGSQARVDAWLKQVPAFLGHEGRVLGWLAAAAPAVAPHVLASDGAGRLLLEHAEGEDCYGASGERREAFARVQHAVQRASMADLEALAREGVPDRRGVRLSEHLRATLSPRVSALPRTARFLDELDAYVARVDDCALPDVLVHGDFHPGNVRASESRITILDWGDSFLGNPAFDLLRLSEGAPPAVAAELLARWSARWRECQKHCEPERAATLLRPLVPLRAAATYARFLDQIEAAEHPFHAVDVTERLQLAESLLAAG
jgi:phosphotransferase family enzyme